LGVDKHLLFCFYKITAPLGAFDFKMIFCPADFLFRGDNKRYKATPQAWLLIFSFVDEF